MRALWTLLAVTLLLGAASWFGWHYLQFRACGLRTCPPLTDREPLILDDGREVQLVGLRTNERGHLVLDYRTKIDRDNRAALCDEARAVWDAARVELETPRLERVFLGSTNPESEFLGMEWGVVPLYACCVTVPIRADRAPTGEWSFPECPG